MDRRTFLKLSGAGLGALALCGSGLAQEGHGDAVTMTPAALDPEVLDGLLEAELGVTIEQLQASDKVTLTVPEVAESGLNVPIEGAVDLPVADVKALHVFVDRNPFPRIASTSFGPLASSAYFATNVRLAETTPVRLIAETVSGEYLMATQEVSVTVGGCS